MGVLVGLGLAAGCRQLNASHCGNQDGNATCAQRNAMAPYCDRCEPTNDGCVVDPVLEPGCGEGETTSNPETTVSATTGSTAAESSDTADGSSTGEPNLCGNGTIDEDEACDGEAFPAGTPSCTEEGFGKGTPACLEDCTQVDYTECPLYMLCGNDEVGFGEQCDGAVFGNGVSSCDDLPHFSGPGLTCTVDCTLDTSACAICREHGESCDDGDECCEEGEECAGLDQRCCVANALGLCTN